MSEGLFEGQQTIDTVKSSYQALISKGLLTHIFHICNSRVRDPHQGIVM
jgi:hypothetical protein